jgi:SWI/SNF-related matrix-associated actin-dependent regulator 1 of chromatin subfamily A
MKFSFSTARLDKHRQLLILKFPMTNSNLMNKISGLPNAVLCYDETWEVSVSAATIEKLRLWEFEMSKSVLAWDEYKLESVTPAIIPKQRDGLKLYDYQKQGVSFIESRSGRALVADEMGLGKTVQALSWLALHPEKRPALVICPSSLKINWERETIKWVPDTKVTILSGTTPARVTGNIVIINYEILHHWVNKLKAHNFQCMIIDEAHYIKNPTAQRTKAFKRMNKYIDNVIALTGTPIENRPIELYNIIQAINPMLFPNYYSYMHRFCGATRNIYGGLDKNGATNTKELNEILKRTIMIRRKKADVLKELPEKQIVQVPLQIDNVETYKKAEREFIAFVKQKFGNHSDEDIQKELKQFAKRHKIKTNDDLSDGELHNLAELKLEKVSIAPVLAQIETLKQLAVEGKLAEIINWVETFLESDEKLVVFAIHRKIVDALMNKFPNAVKIDGSVSNSKRQEAVDKFQKDPKTQLMIANIKAGGVGITLTAASNVAIIQLPWSPSVLSQAIDRVHRITQKHQVTAWILIGENTIEEKILKILKVKENIISQVLDGEDYEDKSVIMELIDSYKKIK